MLEAEFVLALGKEMFQSILKTHLKKQKLRGLVIFCSVRLPEVLSLQSGIAC